MANLQTTEMSDRNILAVINPPAAERVRTVSTVLLPPHETWRFAPRIGKALDPRSQIIRANHFQIDPRGVPGALFQYAVHIYPFEFISKDFAKEDSAGKEDSRILMALLLEMRKKHPEWETAPGFGMTYDGRSLIFTTRELPFAGVNDSGEPFHIENLCLRNLDGAEGKRFRVSLTMTRRILSPATWSNNTDEALLLAMDSPLLSFARWGLVRDVPDWFTVGSKAFRSTSEMFPLSQTLPYVAMRGYYAGLKCCMAGLVLVCDMSVSCFLNGGEMVNLMWQTAGFRSKQDLVLACNRAGGLNPQELARITDAVKNAKVSLRHLGHWRKCKMLGPASNSPASTFDCNGKKMTVSAYFEMMCKDVAKGANYRRVMPSGKLGYPSLPTINVGSATKPILVPAELVVVPGGQCRSNVCTGDMTAQMIKYSAVLPNERMDFISSEASVVSILTTDPTATAFGVNRIDKKPMQVSATLLPQAKLKYAQSKIVDPMLAGTWKCERLLCNRAPPGMTAQGISYGIILVGSRAPPNWEERVRELVAGLERDSLAFGVKLRMGGPPMNSAPQNEALKAKFAMMKSAGVKIVCCGLVDDCYGVVKYAADMLGVTTQCMKWKNVDRPPSGYFANLTLKINTKLGGTNHTLVSRLPTPPATQPAGMFQEPPASLSWLFDKPCMLVGMDVSHAELGSDSESIAAIVGSMDGRASQYAAHISMQTARVEMISALEEGIRSLLTMFKRKNGDRMPASIIVYRDGVADGQFNQVLDKELPLIKGALELMGYPESAVKVSIVVCQKGHHTRIVYEEGGAYINPCPGLVVDAMGENSIASARYNEFYLNSHAAIQGTAKPCKYTLIYDEIGFKLSELELLTYWSTYLYCRCNKSVSYATPAYYAHWASKRGRYLAAAGASPADLLEISNVWTNADKPSSMFFL